MTAKIMKSKITKIILPKKVLGEISPYPTVDKVTMV